MAATYVKIQKHKIPGTKKTLRVVGCSESEIRHPDSGSLLALPEGMVEYQPACRSG